MKKKEKQREAYLEIRKLIVNKEEKSKVITKKVLNDNYFKKANVIAIYKNMENEVCTKWIIENSFMHGKKVVLPKVVDSSLKFYELKSLNEELIRNNFGVEEPEGLDENFIEKEDIDLIILPGVAFDEEKNRIGYGKGYYDRFLGNSKLNTLAIAFDEQIIKDSIIEVDSFDVKVDKIITDRNVYF